jgi:predicted lipoprotein
LGPLLERATEANIDFWPARPQMIDAGIARAITSTKGLRQTGVAGRGFAALERLLWIPAMTPRAGVERPACAYAALLARDIHEEALALETRFGELAAAAPSVDEAKSSLAELINQLVVGVEVLRRKRLFNAVAVGNAKAFARSISDEAQAAWTVRWKSIESLLVAAHGELTFSALLSEHGLQSAARKLSAAVEGVSSAMALASPSRMETVRAAAEALMELRAILQLDVAEGLHIPTRFSDFDGD